MNKLIYSSSCLLAFILSSGLTAQNFTWIKGPSSTGQAGTYGTIGVASSANNPGCRTGAVSWTDTAGKFWLFGGNGKDHIGNSGHLNDLWKYDPLTNQWTWKKGDDLFIQLGRYGTMGTPSATNNPGARESAIGWADASGNLWLFGGYGYCGTNIGIGFMNDLWKFNISTGQWTWIGGSDLINQSAVYGTIGVPSTLNIPGARRGATAWTDNNGNMWLMGGLGIGTSTSTTGRFNDLWKYNPVTNEWTWVSGASEPHQKGIYGVKGTPGANNIPGSRTNSTGWFDTGGNLWIFGGDGFEADSTLGLLNDLWRYSIAGNQWTWVNGTDTIDRSGIYGNMGSASPSNVPGSRSGATSWEDGAGNFWLFGGTGQGTMTAVGSLNDLWKYDRITNRFAWIKGSNVVNIQGSYGTIGLPAATNIPGGRRFTGHWKDNANNLWLFGGNGQDASGFSGALSDLWQYRNCYINPLNIYITSSDSSLCIGESAVLSAIGSNNYSWSSGQTTYSLAVTPTASATYTVYSADNTGCIYNATFTQAVSTCDGFPDLEKNTFAIYPNPCSDILTVRSSAANLLQIRDITGRIVLEAELAMPQTILTVDLPSGLYLYNVAGKNFSHEGKIIVTR
jgi:N-acetylneuraminic acid mutarotase